jgi:phenylacetate-CoA ligase
MEIVASGFCRRRIAMKTALMQLYRRLPAGSRSLPASLWGLYLRSWRYGPETDRLVEAALERESWSAQQWKSWREERLAGLLHRAATQVPYYRAVWRKRRQSGDHRSWERLEHWPLLDKDAVRTDPRAFLADDASPRAMFCEQTSGTSGKPLTLWWSRKTVREWYALFEARCRQWNAVSRKDRWGILGGQLVVPPTSRRPPFWVWNSALRQLYVSTYHLSADFIPYILDALCRYRVDYLFGYSSSLYALALGALRSGRRDWKVRVAITNAEPLYDYQRVAINEAFGCPVRESYGMAEIVAAASECSQGCLHLWPEVGIEEALHDGMATSDEEPAELVCTGLLNQDMPLIRYRVGDRVSFAKRPVGCGCGRRLPILGRVDGRNSDNLVTKDGRRIFWLNPILYGLPVIEAQIVQESLGSVRVLYVPNPQHEGDAGRQIRRRLRERMGEVEVTLEKVSAIPRSASGKFRLVVCRLSREEIEAATSGGGLFRGEDSSGPEPVAAEFLNRTRL